MADRLYACNSGHIKAFPLGLTARPTRAQYTNGVELTDGLIAFQWAPSSPGPETSRSTTGSIFLQQADNALGSRSTILFNSLSYTIKNVQITQSQHSRWLIEDPGQTNAEDLVILLEANSPRQQELVYMIFVIPLLNTGSPANDPEYLKNTNLADNRQWGKGVSSCFPTKTFPTATTIAPLFVHYVTCFDGYTGHARTQNMNIFVSTVAIPVSSATLNRIKNGATPGVIELPTTITNRYIIPSSTGAEAAAAAAIKAGNYAEAGGVTLISPAEFPNRITTTSFSTDYSTQLSNIGNEGQTRIDATSAYQCVELDPSEVDANNNIHIDLESGKIASSTLDDILAEREVMKRLVDPNANINPGVKSTKHHYDFALSVIIILGVLGGLYLFIFSNDTTSGRSFWEMILSVIVALVMLIAAGLVFLSKDTTVQEAGGWMALTGVLSGLLFLLYFVVINPSPTTTECGKTASALAKGTTATVTTAANASQQASIDAATEAKNAEKGWPAFFNSWKGKGIQIGITGAIFGLLGFIIGNVT